MTSASPRKEGTETKRRKGYLALAGGVLTFQVCLRVIRCRTPRGLRMARIGGRKQAAARGEEEDAAARVTDAAAVLQAMSEMAAAGASM